MRRRHSGAHPQALDFLQRAKDGASDAGVMAKWIGDVKGRRAGGNAPGVNVATEGHRSAVVPWNPRLEPQARAPLPPTPVVDDARTPRRLSSPLAATPSRSRPQALV